MQTVPQPEKGVDLRAEREATRAERDRACALTLARRRERRGFRWVLAAIVAAPIWLIMLPFVGMSVAQGGSWTAVAFMVVSGLTILGAFVGGVVAWGRGRREVAALAQTPPSRQACWRARNTLVLAVIALLGAVFAVGTNGWNWLAVLAVLFAGPAAVVLGIGAVTAGSARVTGSDRRMAAIGLALAASSVLIAFVRLFNA